MMSTQSAAAGGARTKPTKVLRKQRSYSHPPAAVWVALTDPRAIAEWLMPSTLKVAEQGATFRFCVDPQRGCGGIKHTDVEILEFEPERRLVWSWTTQKADGSMMDPMYITWELGPTPDGGTLLRFEQRGLEALPWIWRKMMTFGWGTMIKSWLPKVAANVGPDGVFTPGARPLSKRCYKVKTLGDEYTY